VKRRALQVVVVLMELHNPHDSLIVLIGSFPFSGNTHGLTCMAKKTPKASLMVIYYVKLTEIFWVSASHLYHAYAWLKLFTLQKTYNKYLTQRDLQLISSSVVLAALSVSPYDRMRGASHLELENEKELNL
ncbi:hypothetical protein GIB67_036005, partial [Kingdonia uniflora]